MINTAGIFENIRDEVLKDQKSLLENNKIKNTVNYSKIKSIEDIKDEVQLALPQYRGIASQSPKRYNSPAKVKQSDDGSGNLPSIVRSQSIHTKTLPDKNSPSPKRGHVRGGLNRSIDAGGGGGSYAVNHKNRLALNIAQTPGNLLSNKYYFNKEAMYRCKKFMLYSRIHCYQLDRYDSKPIISVRPKRKIGYLPSIEMNVNGMEDRLLERRSVRRGANSQRRVPDSLNRSVDLSPRQRSGTLTDRSFISTESNSSQRGKKRVLVGKNRQRTILPDSLKERALRLHVHIPSRYNESPYVLKFKTQKDRAGNNGSFEGNSDTSRFGTITDEGKMKSNTPKLPKMKNVQKLI